MTNLQKARQSYRVAKEVWVLANKGQVSRKTAARHMNRSRAWLKREIKKAEAYFGRQRTQ